MDAGISGGWDNEWNMPPGGSDRPLWRQLRTALAISLDLLPRWLWLVDDWKNEPIISSPSLCCRSLFRQSPSHRLGSSDTARWMLKSLGKEGGGGGGGKSYGTKIVCPFRLRYTRLIYTLWPHVDLSAATATKCRMQSHKQGLTHSHADLMCASRYLFKKRKWILNLV